MKSLIIIGSLCLIGIGVLFANSYSGESIDGLPNNVREFEYARLEMSNIERHQEYNETMNIKIEDANGKNRILEVLQVAEKPLLTFHIGESTKKNIHNMTIYYDDRDEKTFDFFYQNGKVYLQNNKNEIFELEKDADLLLYSLIDTYNDNH